MRRIVLVLLAALGGCTSSPKSDALQNGASVVAVSVPPGDPNCPYGGSRFTSSDGTVTYACNGAPGTQGDRGPIGQQGAQGPQGVPGTPYPMLTGVVGYSYSETVVFGPATAGPSVGNLVPGDSNSLPLEVVVEVTSPDDVFLAFYAFSAGNQTDGFPSCSSGVELRPVDGGDARYGFAGASCWGGFGVNQSGSVLLTKVNPGRWAARVYFDPRPGTQYGGGRHLTVLRVR